MLLCCQVDPNIQIPICESIGQNEIVLDFYESILTAKKQIINEENSDYSARLNNLATIYEQMSHYEKALPLYEEVTSLYKKNLGEKHPDYAASLNNLALLYKKMCLYEKSLQLYRQALAIKIAGSDEVKFDYATTLNNLALLYMNMAQYERALALLKRTKKIWKKTEGEDHIDYATCLNNLAFLYKEMGCCGRALTFMIQAKNIYAKTLGEKHPLYARSLHNLALVYVKMGQYQEALSLHEQAMSLRKEILGGDHFDYITSLYNLSLLFLEIRQNDKALPLLIEASTLTLKYLTRTYITLSEQEKIILLNEEAYKFNYLISLWFLQGNQPFAVYANELVLKSMILEDQKAVLNSIRKSKDITAFELYEEWYSNKMKIGKLLLLPLKELGNDLKNLEGATNQLEQQLSRRSVIFRQQQQHLNITPNEIAWKLSRTEAAVEFIRFRVYNRGWTDSMMYAALLLLPHDPNPKFIQLCEESDLIGLLGMHSASLYDPDGKLNSILYLKVWKPLEDCLKPLKEQLKKDEIVTIYYAPSGLLNRVAFQALYTDTEELLMDKYNLHQLFSTRAVAFRTEQNLARLQSASVWGDIDYNEIMSKIQEASSSTPAKSEIDGKEAKRSGSFLNTYVQDTMGERDEEWPSLLGTKEQIERISALLRNRNVTVIQQSGKQATKKAFKTMDGNSPHVLHVTTHGFFLPIQKRKAEEALTFTTQGKEAYTVQQNPLFRSGLVLAGGNRTWRGETMAEEEDGILTAYDIAHMDLSNTELVVLSACETALGDINGCEGVIGLQRAFKLAGVKQIIMSLWQVQEKATTELMIKFYQNWFGGQTARQALRDAQMEMKKKYDHPYYWAAFVLVE